MSLDPDRFVRRRSAKNLKALIFQEIPEADPDRIAGQDRSH